MTLKWPLHIGQTICPMHVNGPLRSWHDKDLEPVIDQKPGEQIRGE